MKDKNSYALGMSIAHNLLSSGFDEIEIEDFVAGLRTLLDGREPEIGLDEAGEVLEKYFAQVEKAREEKAKAAGAAARLEGEQFLEENAGREGVVTLKSGLQYKVLREGNGAKPKAVSKVRCHYEGRLVNGQIFDSSYDRGEPAVFGLNQVIRGWTEGLQLMAEGAEYEFYIPYDLGYGSTGASGAIPPFSALIFKVELIEVL